MALTTLNHNIGEVCRTGKRIHRRRRNAVAFLKIQRKRGIELTEENIYRCSECKGWHLGRHFKRVKDGESQ